jgi:16S rRNA processing protein RimM
MSAAAGEPSAQSDGARSKPLSAGRVGRPHGLDGSFYVTGARPRLLALGTKLEVAGQSTSVVRRAGTDTRPIVRLGGVEDRADAEALRGQELTVDSASMPALEEGEWWASELEGCRVVDGERHVGTVKRLVELPSCEALEVLLDPSDRGPEAVGKQASELLIPMVREAIRRVDVPHQRIDVDMGFLEDLL